MKEIIIFGASGRTGKEVSMAAQAKRIKVNAFNKKNPLLEELQKAVKGVDGVVIVFGPRPPFTDIFCEDLTKKIIKAMEKESVKRLICQTGAMIGNYPNNLKLIFRIMSNKFHKSNPEVYNDRAGQEESIKRSNLEWTIIKPPRLSDAINNKKVKSGENLKVGLMSSISRKSLAEFIINELLNPLYNKKVVFVKN